MRHLRTHLGVAATALLLFAAGAQAQVAAAQATAAEPSLFAVEIRVGPTWDPAKPPQEQAFFREHSANLRRLRESGSLVVGARYSDVGLVVVTAGHADEVRAMMAADPSFDAGTFVFQVHPLNVFYSGQLK